VVQAEVYYALYFALIVFPSVLRSIPQYAVQFRFRHQSGVDEPG
jgi:hypothetical protein